MFSAELFLICLHRRGEAGQPPGPLYGPPLNTPQQVYVLLMLLNTITRACSLVLEVSDVAQPVLT